MTISPQGSTRQSSASPSLDSPVSPKQPIVKAGKPASRLCVWSLEDVYGVWETSCGNMFEITEGTPSQNDMKFCCYCGKKLKEKLEE